LVLFEPRRRRVETTHCLTPKEVRLVTGIVTQLWGGQCNWCPPQHKLWGGRVPPVPSGLTPLVQALAITSTEERYVICYSAAYTMTHAQECFYSLGSGS